MQRTDFIPITDGIKKVIEAEESFLRDLPVEVITLRRNKQSRTVKQILGHLIDSASNIINAWFVCNIVKTYYSSPTIVRTMICGSPYKTIKTQIGKT